jgi:hypothetical protein
MSDNLFWIAVGLLIGWNVLPQPGWVKALYDKLLTKLKTMTGGHS